MGYASENRFVNSLELEDDKMIVVAEGDLESSSDGSYIVQLYTNKGVWLDGSIQEREGNIVDTWIVDLNNDNQQELLVWLRSQGNGNYGSIDVFQVINDSDKPALHFETKLMGGQGKGYSGHDRFWVEDKVLYSEHAVYNEEDANCCPSGGRVQYTLNYHTRTWSFFETVE